MSRTVADNDAGALPDGVDGDLEGQVVSDEDDGLALLGVCFCVAEEEADIVPCPVCEVLRVQLLHGGLDEGGEVGGLDLPCAPGADFVHGCVLRASAVVRLGGPWDEGSD